jgi:hypothetical protein
VEQPSDLNRRERARTASNCTAATCEESVSAGQRACRACWQSRVRGSNPLSSTLAVTSTRSESSQVNSGNVRLLSILG